jgi:hypothetical protein
MRASPVPAADITVDGTGLLCVSLLLRLRSRFCRAEARMGTSAVGRTAVVRPREA